MCRWRPNPTAVPATTTLATVETWDPILRPGGGVPAGAKPSTAGPAGALLSDDAPDVVWPHARAVTHMRHATSSITHANARRRTSGLTVWLRWVPEH